MIYKEELISFIQTYTINTPIFIEEIKEYFNRLISDDTEYKRVMNSIYTYLNRLVKKEILKSFSNGVYYNGSITKYKIIENVCKKGTSYYNKTLGVRVRKPRVKITNENYKYLELLDKIKYENLNKEDMHIFMINNNLNFEELFRYAIISKNKNYLEKLY